VSHPDGYALCGAGVDAVAFTRDVEAALPADAAARVTAIAISAAMLPKRITCHVHSATRVRISR
jgi:hypothetical protein